MLDLLAPASHAEFLIPIGTIPAGIEPDGSASPGMPVSRDTMAGVTAGTLTTVAPAGAETVRSHVPAPPVTLTADARSDVLGRGPRRGQHDLRDAYRRRGRLREPLEARRAPVRLRKREIAPEFELFDPGHVTTMKRLLDRPGPGVGLDDTLTFTPGLLVRDKTELVQRGVGSARHSLRSALSPDGAGVILGLRQRRHIPTQTGARA